MKKRTQGMNFVRQEKRLAIYLRDDLACAYCGVGIETPGTILSLDHLHCYDDGGSHHETNLVTCCTRCNSSRGKRPVKTFAAKVAGYINSGRTAAQIIAHIDDCITRPLDVKAAKEMIARRGSCAKVIAEMN